jgi:hypothetical protein
MTADDPGRVEEKQTPVQKARADLVATLNEIEDRLNVPRRFYRKAREFQREKPWVFGALAAAGATAVGAAGWLLVALRRR